jgi:hypothetical protein
LAYGGLDVRRPYPTSARRRPPRALSTPAAAESAGLGHYQDEASLSDCFQFSKSHSTSAAAVSAAAYNQPFVRSSLEFDRFCSMIGRMDRAEIKSHGIEQVNVQLHSIVIVF